MKDAAITAGLQKMLSDPEARAVLAAAPDPRAYWANRGRTLLDWADWMAEFAGAKGRKAVWKAINEAMAPKGEG